MKDFNDIGRNDDFSQFFRDSAENLEANPSYTAWDKLERKLDSRRLRKRAVIYRYTSMVAAAVGVVALFMVFKLLNKVENLDNVSDSAPFAQLEKAPLTEDERRIAKTIEQHKKEAKQVEKINKVLPSAPTENVSDDILVKKNKNTSREPIASNRSDDAPKPQAPKAQKVPESKKALVEREDLKRDEGSYYTDVDIEEEAEEAIKPEKVVADYLVVMPEKPTKTNSNLNSAGNPVPSKDKMVAKKEKAAREEIVRVDKERVDLNTIPTNAESEIKEVSTYGKKEKSKTTLTQFSWMAGKWKDALKADSYENWFVDKTEIVGEGYVLVDGKKEFAEYMRIYQSGKNVYFESSIDETKKIRKFKLESYEKNQAVFERKSRKFPNKVTITQVSNGAFRITYMNKNDGNITESQAKYFNTRNNISVERASRSMNKY